MPAALAEDMERAFPPAQGSNNPFGSGLLSFPYPDTVLETDKSDKTPSDRIVKENADRYVSGDIKSSFWKDFAANTPSGKANAAVMAMCTDKDNTTQSVELPFTFTREDNNEQTNIVTREYVDWLRTNKGDYAVEGFVSRFKRRDTNAENRIKRAFKIAYRRAEMNALPGVEVDFIREGKEISPDLKCVLLTIKRAPYIITLGEMLGYNLAKAKNPETGEVTIKSLRASVRGKRGAGAGNQDRETAKVKHITGLTTYENYVAETAAFELEETRNGNFAAKLMMYIGTGKDEKKDFILSLYRHIMCLDPVYEFIKKRGEALEAEAHRAQEAVAHVA
jgi:hypothetical protein